MSASRVVMIIGAGAREHALAVAALRSPTVERVLVAPGNGGMEHEALRDARIIRVPDATYDPDELLVIADRYGVDLTIVGPESVLAAGVVDRFKAEGRRIFGPTRMAAQIETSKAYAKAFMLRHGIPTARGGGFETYAEARAALHGFGAPVVVKASGLAAGKGVFVCERTVDAEDAVWRLMEAGELGGAGREVVIEECLVGRELSVMALTDGTDLLVLPVARDHKRLGDGDEGPNTGGMGAYSPVPDVDAATIEAIAQTIIAPAVAGLAAEGRRFVGVLYAGCMLTAEGPKCLEFNARFGDPETQVILPRLKTDLIALIDACIETRLSEATLEVSDETTVGVVVAAPGYPGDVQPGAHVSGLEAARTSAEIYSAGLGLLSSGYAALGGRVLTIVGRGADLATARTYAYRAVDALVFEGMQVRRDIAATSTYAQAGVDIAAANAAVRGIGDAVRSTFNPFVLSKLGSFGGLFDAKAFAGLAHPVLVASTDGVGTKTMIARAMNRWNTIGRDLIAHSVNDILVMGARPLFFLDYIASGKLDPAVVIAVVEGLAAGCRELGVALLGGETAEMPGVYHAGEVDLAGTIVGVVERADIIDGSQIVAGDQVFGLASSGLHTNGYSLARKVFEGMDLASVPEGFDVSLGDALLAVHRPYLSEITTLWDAGIRPSGLVHITGGGFVDNPPRITPAGLTWSLDLHAWQWPPLFRLLQQRGGISDAEMSRVTNLGIGMLVVLHPDQVERARGLLPELVAIGSIVEAGR